MARSDLTGGCLCGAVRYRIAGPALRTSHCHCEMCRKTHGSLFATYSRVESARFTLDAADGALRAYESSPGISRSFCGQCGAQMFFQRTARPEILSVAAGTLDEGMNPGHPPETERHIYVASKAPWDQITGGLPQDDTGSPNQSPKP